MDFIWRDHNFYISILPPSNFFLLDEAIISDKVDKYYTTDSFIFLTSTDKLGVKDIGWRHFWETSIKGISRERNDSGYAGSEPDDVRVSRRPYMADTERPIQEVCNQEMQGKQNRELTACGKFENILYLLSL